MADLLIRKPDDWHIHLRDGAALKLTVKHAARQFGRVIAMPNLRPPIDSIEAARSYRSRILEAVPPEFRGRFHPITPLYLTERVTPSVIEEAAKTDFIRAVKLYPAGATTNSESGVEELSSFYDVFDEMQKHRMPLLIHGEVTDVEVDVFDRERVFVERVLHPLRERFRELPIVLEHVSSKEGVHFVESHSQNTAATITVHHMLLTRSDIFQGGLQPHHFCLPVVKTEEDRQAVRAAALSGKPCFFAGTDSAPHPRHKKESACGAAGIYTAHGAVELYAEIFDQEGQLHRLEAFLSEYGARFYGLPPAEERIRLVRKPWIVPDRYDMGGDELIPFRAGHVVSFSLEEGT
jgi:dihydroorotase